MRWFVGQPITVRGRFLDFLGLDNEPFVVRFVGKRANGGPIIMQEGGGMAKRRGWWAYEIEIELSPIRKPCDYDLQLLSLTKSVRDGKKKMQDDPIRRQITVHAAEAEMTATP
jgi:hypothetical protein